MNTRSFGNRSPSAISNTSISRRYFFKYLRIAGIIAIFTIVLGGTVMYAVDSNNRMMTKEILRLRSSFESRMQRSLREARREVEVSNIKRSKRALGDDDRDDAAPVTGSGGVTYERWGRQDCSGPDNELIYNGIGAGAHYSHSGGVSKQLCLHLGVTYGANRYIDGFNGASYIYGMEFRDSTWINPLFNFSLTESNTIQYHSVPCAICLAKRRFSKIMIPGQDSCPNGWNTEYRGYIMSAGHSDKHASTALCVDDTPQVVPGTKGSQTGNHLFIVETQCTSLLCEPFVEGRELSCVVCTK